jgi:hypothetical protein
MAVTRARAEEYRRLAQECLTAARTVTTKEAQTALIESAELWLRLAEEQDGETANVEPPMPPNPIEDRPVVQQQQEVQPKDDDDNKE